MTWGIFKTDSVSDTVKKLQDVNQKINEEDTETDTAITPAAAALAKKKKVKEEAEHLDEVSLNTASGAYSARVNKLNKSKFDTDEFDDNYGKASDTLNRISKKHGVTGKQTAVKKAGGYDVNESELDGTYTEFSLFNETELDMLISEASNDNMTAGAWINDFLHAQQRLMATKGMGKDTSEKRKDAKALALAAYYNHQARGKKAEFTEGRLNLDAKEIKHINLKDKRNDAEIMEPRAEGEKAFVDTHTLIVTNDPTQTKYDAGTGKVGKAVEPKAQGAGKYDAKEKLGNQGITSKKGEFSEAIVNTGPTATGCQVGEVIDTAPQEKKAKKTYGKFKQEIGHEIK